MMIILFIYKFYSWLKIDEVCGLFNVIFIKLNKKNIDIKEHIRELKF